MAISTPAEIGDVFHRLCSRGDLAEAGKLGEELGYQYKKVHWSEAGRSQKEVDDLSIGSTGDLGDQEWEWKLSAPGTVVFNPTHLAVCYKPLADNPQVVADLERYATMVEKAPGRYMYYAGVDTIVGKAHRRSKDKDFNSYTVMTANNVQVAHYYNQSPISKWAGKTVDNVRGGRSEIVGETSQYHAEWPGVVYIEEDGPGLTTYTNHTIPRDTYSFKFPAKMSSAFKQEIIQYLILKIEAHTITITDPFTYHCMMVFQNLGAGKYGAPEGYNDDPVISLALASYARDKHAELAVHIGNLASNELDLNIQHPYQSSKLGGEPTIRLSIPEEAARLSDIMAPGEIPVIANEPLLRDWLEEELLETARIGQNDLPA
jgi:hypothetical protein